jgi:hypothetical protein
MVSASVCLLMQIVLRSRILKIAFIVFRFPTKVILQRGSARGGTNRILCLDEAHNTSLTVCCPCTAASHLSACTLSHYCSLASLSISIFLPPETGFFKCQDLLDQRPSSFVTWHKNCMHYFYVRYFQFRFVVEEESQN